MLHGNFNRKPLPKLNTAPVLARPSSCHWRLRPNLHQKQHSRLSISHNLMQHSVSSEESHVEVVGATMHTRCPASEPHAARRDPPGLCSRAAGHSTGAACCRYVRCSHRGMSSAPGRGCGTSRTCRCSICMSASSWYAERGLGGRMHASATLSANCRV